MVLFFLFSFYCKWENKRRNRVYGARDDIDGEADDQGIQAGFMDKNDTDNKQFRYAY